MVLLELNTAFVRVAQLYRQQADKEKMIYAQGIEKVLKQALNDLGKKATLESS